MSIEVMRAALIRYYDTAREAAIAGLKAGLLEYDFKIISTNDGYLIAIRRAIPGLIPNGFVEIPEDVEPGEILKTIPITTRH